MRRGIGNRQRRAADDVAEAERQKRRSTAWRLRVIEKLTEDEIAQRLGVSHGTVVSDLARAREDYKPPDAADMQAFVRAELLDAIDGLREARGEPQAVTAKAKVLDLLCKLHGLYAPTKAELSGANGGPLDIRAAQDELLGRIARIADDSGSGTSDPKPQR